MKDGKYTVYDAQDGNRSTLGCFEIKDGSISFPSDKDRLNIDEFPAGPMSQHTEQHLSRLMKGGDEGVHIEKESDNEPVKKFGENNSV